MAVSELEGASYQHWDKDAAKRMIRVAAGLDSQMLGEPQIMGQVKAAYDLARRTGTWSGVGSTVTYDHTHREGHSQSNGCWPQSNIRHMPQVSLATQIFADLKTKHALLLGAGDTISLVAEHLTTQKVSLAWLSPIGP